MNKAALIAKVAERTQTSRKDADRAVNAVLDIIAETLAAGDTVQLVGFGAFEVRDRAARVGRNPQTGEAIPIAASKVPSFKAGKTLREIIG